MFVDLDPVSDLLNMCDHHGVLMVPMDTACRKDEVLSGNHEDSCVS